MKKWLQEASAQTSFGHRSHAGSKRGQEVNLGLTLNSPSIIVRPLKDPAALELEWGHTDVSRPQWSTEWWGKDEGDPVYQLTQNLWLCYYCVLLCTQRWIGSAFSATKSLGMHTEAGSGNSNTALSWAVKEDNTSCPLWTGLVNIQIHIFCRETLPTERAFLFCLFFPQNGLQLYEYILL